MAWTFVGVAENGPFDSATWDVDFSGVAWAADDFAVAVLGGNTDRSMNAAPTGWDLRGNVVNSGTFDVEGWIYTKQLTVGEDETIAWTMSGTNAGLLALAVWRPDAAEITVEDEDAVGTVAGTSHSTPSATSVTADALVIAAFTYNLDAAGTNRFSGWTGDAGTERYDGNNGTGVKIGIASGIRASAGSGAVSVTTADSQATAAFILIVSEVAGGGPSQRFMWSP